MSPELEFSDIDAGHEIEAETSDVPLLNAEDQTTAPAATQRLLHQGRRQVYKSVWGGGAWMEGSRGSQWNHPELKVRSRSFDSCLTQLLDH